MKIEQLFNYLENVIHFRFEKEFRGIDIKIPELTLRKTKADNLSAFIVNEHLTNDEIIVLLLALVSHVSPDFFTGIITKYLPNGGDFPEFGGVKGKNHRGILPTGETVLYILAGKNLEQRTALLRIFEEDHLFTRKNILYVESVPAGEPKMSGRLILDEEYVDLFTSGKIIRPKLSSDFPAQLITTQHEWRDLVLQEKTLEEIKELETWLKYNAKLLADWNMAGKIKPGYRVMFHGPPGTGKTLTACLLGKYTGRDVFRIDLSLIVSKYIGETEKNLSKLFDKASNKDWILFFDEADSIFGKRTNVRDAHDKYANQEVSYLLQRIEAHAGLVILATNMKANIDQAFTRRFNAFVEFENPGVAERQRLWKNYLPENISLEKSVNVDDLAKNFDLTGANIVNVIHFAGLKTFQKKKKTIALEDLKDGIEKEYRKEGKLLRKS